MEVEGQFDDKVEHRGAAGGAPEDFRGLCPWNGTTGGPFDIERCKQESWLLILCVNELVYITNCEMTL